MIRTAVVVTLVGICAAGLPPDTSGKPLEPPVLSGLSGPPHEPNVFPPRQSGPPQRRSLQRNSEGPQPAFPPRQSDVPLEPPSRLQPSNLPEDARPPRSSALPQRPRDFQRRGDRRQPANFPGKDAIDPRSSDLPLEPPQLPPRQSQMPPSGQPMEPPFPQFGAPSVKPGEFQPPRSSDFPQRAGDFRPRGLRDTRPVDLPGKNAPGVSVQPEEPPALHQSELPLEPPTQQSGKPREPYLARPSTSLPQSIRDFLRLGLRRVRQPADFPGKDAPDARTSDMPPDALFPPMQSEHEPLSPPPEAASGKPQEHLVDPPRTSSGPPDALRGPPSAGQRRP